jgi:hypothetical protein
MQGTSARDGLAKSVASSRRFDLLHFVTVNTVCFYYIGANNTVCFDYMGQTIRCVLTSLEQTKRCGQKDGRPGRV